MARFELSAWRLSSAPDKAKHLIQGISELYIKWKGGTGLQERRTKRNQAKYVPLRDGGLRLDTQSAIVQYIADGVRVGFRSRASLA
jgi:hypothetical protein